MIPSARPSSAVDAAKKIILKPIHAHLCVPLDERICRCKLSASAAKRIGGGRRFFAAASEVKKHEKRQRNL
jgi:hypothetical protein